MPPSYLHRCILFISHGWATLLLKLWKTWLLTVLTSDLGITIPVMWWSLTWDMKTKLKCMQLHWNAVSSCFWKFYRGGTKSQNIRGWALNSSMHCKFCCLRSTLITNFAEKIWKISKMYLSKPERSLNNNKENMNITVLGLQCVVCGHIALTIHYAEAHERFQVILLTWSWLGMLDSSKVYCCRLPI